MNGCDVRTCEDCKFFRDDTDYGEKFCAKNDPDFKNLSATDVFKGCQEWEDCE